MPNVRSGLFTPREFSYRRNALKLAPDAFVVVNGALTSRVLSPMKVEQTQDIDIRGGITSVNVSAAVSPPGSSKATIEITTPMYKGLHEDYFVTLPNGVRAPFFMPMMEVKIYMKGRFLEPEYKYVTQYYPVFWGMITNVQENYSSGNYNITLSCDDFLVWWRFQKITLNPGIIDSFYGGALQTKFPTVFEKMSPWEIIYSMFTDNFFIQHKKDGTEAFFNFVYPQWSKTAMMPDSLVPVKDTFGPMSSLVMDYWNDRFGMGVSRDGDIGQIKSEVSQIPLEMFGLRGPIKQETVQNKIMTFLDYKDKQYSGHTDTAAALDLDFGLLARVQPFGAFDLFGQGTEPTIMSKMEIATAVCEKVQMEFFVDTNGKFVFKPPFYNLDVASAGLKHYRIGPEDVIDFNATFDSNVLINYLTVTGPMYQQIPSLEAIGFHVDFDSVRKYGIRAEQVNIPYGMNGKQLRMIAVAEMSRRNGQAFSGSVTIPLRPEMRLGYPVYMEHIDAFYYVTGINHSFSFGSSATTSLTLEFRRDKVFDDGNSGIGDSQMGDVLYSCVIRNRENELSEEFKKSKPDFEKIKDRLEKISFAKRKLETGEETSEIYDVSDLDTLFNETKKNIIAAQNNIMDGPNMMGTWKVDRATVKLRSSDQIKDKEKDSAYSANELVMMTNESLPYTDKLGYKHIGAFPYGANLVLSKNGMMRDMTDFIEKTNHEVDVLMNCNGAPEISSDNPSSEDSKGMTIGLNSDSSMINETVEVTIKDYTDQVEKRREMEQDLSQYLPFYGRDERARYEALAHINASDKAAKAQMDVPIDGTLQCTKESYQNESTYSG